MLKFFSSKRKKSSQLSLETKNSNHQKEIESSDESLPKVAARSSSNSISDLTEVDSFESIWATRSDSSAEEATAVGPKEEPINKEVGSDVKLEVVSSPSFEKELSTVLLKTIEKLPEVDTEASQVDCEEKEALEIDCSVEYVEADALPSPPSSTNAIFSGDFNDFSFTSEGATSVTSESNAVSPPPKPPTVSRTQDIFRPKKIEGLQSPVGFDDEQLHVKFTPSFEGIEMANSFQQLETIEEEPSWYSPSMSFEVDEDNIRHDSASMTQGLKLMALWILLLFSIHDARLQLNKVGVPLTDLVSPTLEDLFTKRAPTNGPVVHKTFYNSHHTTMGAWLK